MPAPILLILKDSGWECIMDKVSLCHFFEGTKVVMLNLIQHLLRFRNKFGMTVFVLWQKGNEGI